MLAHLKWTIVELQFFMALQHLVGAADVTVTWDQEYGSENKVVELTDSNFDELVLNSDKSWLVNFHSPQCGFCLELQPDWAEAARILANSTEKAKLGSLDITVHSVKQAEHRIKYTPSIRYFPPGSKSPSDAEKYRSSRKPHDLVAFVLNKVAYLLPTGNNTIQTEPTT